MQPAACSLPSADLQPSEQCSLQPAAFPLLISTKLTNGQQHFIFLLLVFCQFLNQTGILHCKQILIFMTVLLVPIQHKLQGCTVQQNDEKFQTVCCPTIPYRCTHAHAHTRTHTHAHAHAHVHTHTHTHTHTQCPNSVDGDSVFQLIPT